MSMTVSSPPRFSLDSTVWVVIVAVLLVLLGVTVLYLE